MNRKDQIYNEAVNMQHHFEALEVKTGATRKGAKSVSFGKASNVTSFIDEASGAIELSYSLVNDALVDQKVLFAPIVPKGAVANGVHDVNTTMFATEQEALTATRSDVVFGEKTVSIAGKDFIISSTDPARKISELLRYMALNPTRIIKMSMTSTKISNGEKDKTNFSQVVKTFFVSPFDTIVEKPLNLKTLQVDKFNYDALDVDFQKTAFPVIISNENLFQFSVKAGTRLDISFFFGAQFSNSQEFYRKVKDADAIMRPRRLGEIIE
jgi:hypothetical protein